VTLVSDATPAAGLPPGRYRMGGLEAEVHAEGYATAAGGLAGSVIPLVTALREAVRSAQLPLADAVRMATATPAGVLGLGQRKGRVAPGFDADLLLLDADLCPRAVYRAGALLPGR
jgi:N-acetylglucosamine-6-phosphate deacetylase